MSAYGVFARYYDALMAEVDYAARAHYLLELFERYAGKRPQTVLDLACGTGSVTLELMKLGADVIGVDLSFDMLSIAREKAAKAQQNPLFVCQDLARLDLYGTSEGAVCTLDGLNHIIDSSRLEAAFTRLHYFLEPGGLFLFDVNTPYKQEQVLANNAFVYDLKEVFCVWQNSYHAQERRTDICLDFFWPDGGVYRRATEEFSERAYTAEEWQKLLQKTGFECLAVLDDLTFCAPGPVSVRNIYVVKRK